MHAAGRARRVTDHDGRAPAPSDTALLETLILQAPVAFAFYGPDLRYRRINRMLADINGLPMDDHIGRRPSELLGDARRRGRGAAARGARDRRGRHRRRLHRACRRSPASCGHYQSQWFPARDADGAVIGVAVLVSDVTERRRAEAALRRSVERTEQLQQATAALGEALTVADVRRVVAATGTRRPPAPAPRRAAVASRPGEHLLAAAPAGAGPGSRSPWWCPAARIGALRPRLRRPTSWTAEDAVPGCARRPVRDRAGAGPAVRAGAVDRGRPCSAACCRTGCRRCPGVELAARFRAGSAEADVGGDWYDVFSLPGRPAGARRRRRDGQGRPGRGRHGPAALRAAGPGARQPAAGGGADRPGPGVHRHRGADQIATLVYLLVNPVARRAAVGGAGHLPLVLRRAGQRARAGGRRVRVHPARLAGAAGPAHPGARARATCCSG